MVQITYTLRLDMRDTGIVNTSLRLKQGDSGMKIAVNVFNGGVSAFDSSTTPKIVFRRPDGASVMADMTVESSLYSYTLVGNELQVPGKELIDIKFPIGAEGRESTMSCSIEVVPDTITPNTHGSGIYDNDLAELVEEATEAAETVQEVVGDSEAWADGTRGGVPVGPDDPAYHNNSKYWSEQANPTALANLTDVDVDGVVNGDLLQYNSTTHKWEASDTVIEQVEKLKDAWQENGAYNLCQNEQSDAVRYGVTYIKNSDGTVSTSGTMANDANEHYGTCVSGGTLPSARTYKLVGCPNGGSSTTYCISITVRHNGVNTTYYDTGSGVQFNYASGDTIYVYGPRFGTGFRGQSANGLVFKPMITTDLNATYDDYVPYAKTNEQLTLDTRRFVKVAEAAANQTWAAQLTALLSAFNSLSAQDKARAVISANDEYGADGLYRLAGRNVATFSLISLGGTGVVNIVTLRLSNSTAQNVQIATNGTVTSSDISSATNALKLVLCLD